MSCGKVPYKSKTEANQVAKAISNKPRNKKRARVYLCHICNIYHITSKESSYKKSKRKMVRRYGRDN